MHVADNQLPLSFSVERLSCVYGLSGDCGCVVGACATLMCLIESGDAGFTRDCRGFACVERLELGTRLDIMCLTRTMYLVWLCVSDPVYRTEKL